jgi:hypothetical protein
VGWWDTHTLLVHDEGNNFVLLDVITRKTSTLLSAEATSEFMVETGLPGGPADIGWVCHWNGGGYDLFLTLEKQKNCVASANVRGPKNLFRGVNKAVGEISAGGRSARLSRLQPVSPARSACL